MIGSGASTSSTTTSQPEVGSGLRSAPKHASGVAPSVAAVEPTVPFHATAPFPSEPRWSVAWSGVAPSAGEPNAHARTRTAAAVARTWTPTLPPGRLNAGAHVNSGARAEALPE